ncbi:MAG TPA: hypothetical protein VLX56_01025 [Nitrososphaerales archaeon]|nr:hypothetical protein [Nitrososphaerales archaeon]
MGTRYLPAEDTRLLGEALRGYTGERCLEIGFGSGALLEGVAPRFDLAVGTDVIGLRDASQASSGSAGLVLADRAACFREGVFDLVFFNPPYVPSGEVEDRAVDGGPTGTEVPLAFVEEGARVMKRDGTMVALLSEEGDLGRFVSECARLGLDAKRVSQRRLFYETLVVFEVRRRPTLIRKP